MPDDRPREVVVERLPAEVDDVRELDQRRWRTSEDPAQESPTHPSLAERRREQLTRSDDPRERAPRRLMLVLLAVGIGVVICVAIVLVAVAP
ncbi:hypothetical protein [Tsukamurella soli]|uniref:Uncharacterized protein n=1 Tax=Tsukamurella soli TaxID=644556 RepID=A0ABP8JP79_9ACTN